MEYEYFCTLSSKSISVSLSGYISKYTNPQNTETANIGKMQYAIVVLIVINNPVITKSGNITFAARTQLTVFPNTLTL